MLKSSHKSIISFITALVVLCIAVLAFYNGHLSGTAYGADTDNVIELTIDDPNMTVNGETVPIDDEGTAPLIVSDRTLVPVRAIMESLGGSVSWDGDTKTASISYNSSTIELTIDNTTAFIDGSEYTLDSPATIINGRTMLPIRFVSEGLGFSVDWDSSSKTITITVEDSAEITEQNTEQNTDQTEAGSTQTAEVWLNTEHATDDENAPVVYFTNEISSDAIMEIYSKLGFEPEGNVAIKLSTGEAGGNYYLDPNLIKDLVQSVDGTIVECNTAYGGSRIETAMHKQVAADHGFTAIADVDIMDETGSIQLPVSDKAVNLKYDVVGKNYENYDSMIVLSHFKGHAMGGFGGAIKNISIGISSPRGKNYIHSGGHSETGFDNDSYLENFVDANTGTSEDVGANFMKVAGLGTQDQFLESMAEAAQAVHNDKQKNGGIVYISVMNHLSVDCDCDGNPAEPEMHDVGILASTDPVALDQACVDIVYNTDREESGALIERMESRNGIHTLEHAEEIGLGSRSYRLVNINE